jgi:hypothetical protein
MKTVRAVIRRALSSWHPSHNLGAIDGDRYSYHSTMAIDLGAKSEAGDGYSTLFLKCALLLQAL